MTNHKKTLTTFWETTIKVVLFALAAFLLVQFMSCQKELSSLNRESRTIEADHHLMPEGGYNLAKRPELPELWEAARKGGNGKGKGGGRPPKDTTTQEPPTDTTYNPPPTYNGQGVILLDFDGQYVTGTSWNVSGPIDCKPANQSPDEIAYILARVQADYSPFTVLVTTDSSLYHAAPANKRMRVIITESYEWYGRAGGVAYVGSFSWGDGTPAFVFNSLLGYNVKMVSDAISHEAGHTLGLRHQGKCQDGVKTAEYNPDLAANGLGYLMGYPYNYPSGWQVGVTPYCSPQDDRAMILSALSR
jgi:hypothetical protein